MTRSKKVLMAVGGVVFALVLVLFLTPLLFSDQIEERVRAEVEKTSGVQVSWSDARLGLLGDFPHPSLRLTELVVRGPGSLAADTLAAIDELAVSLDGSSLLGALRGGGPLVVRTVTLDRPRVRLRVAEDGATNWPRPEAAPETESGAESGAGMAVSLQRLEITDGVIDYEDARTRSAVSLRGFEHTLRGDFSRAALEAETRTHADALSVRIAGTPYLNNVGLDYQGSVRVDTESGVIELADQELSLNDLALQFGGSMARDDAGTAVDLTFTAPDTDFRSLLSLASALYDDSFAEIQTTGTFTLDGDVRGRYGDDSFPAFSMQLAVADGRFQYPDLPLPAEDIAAELSVTNPGGALDSTVVDLSRFHVRIGSETFEASARITTPVTDPEVDARVNGTVNLADVARTVKLERLEGLTGVVTADASVRARRSDLVEGRYERVDAQGTINAADVSVSGEALRQPVDVRALGLILSPRAAELTTLDAQLGSSDVLASGRLDNLLGYMLGGTTLEGSARFESRRVVLDEWRSGEAVDAIPVPAGIDMSLEGSIAQLEMNGLTFTNARGRALVRDQRLTFEGFRLDGFGGSIALDGHYETTEAERPTFALTLGLDSLDIRQTATALPSFRTLAPVAEFARGSFTTDLELNGALGQNLTLDLTVLNGDGSFSTSPVAVEGFPLLDRVAERLELPRFSNPTVNAIRSSMRIQNGRLVVDPFRVDVGGIGMSVAGSNGIDQSIDYGLTIEVPRAGLAGSVMDGLTARAGPLASRLASIDPVPIRVQATGFVRDPSLDVGVADLTQSARNAVTDAAGQAAESQIDDARAQADSTAAEARRRAQARADSVVSAAERQAENIRSEAARAAAEVRAQGDRAAEELLARASNPLERAAAQRAADRLRSEADERATAIEAEADARATQVVEEARTRAAQIVSGSGGG
ncbi:MAG: hypothetical protein HKN72_15290 [Gemmatimonadetes bacterium]|nr:hypothetical protein [Gemmatimonadota bacterium]